MFSFSYTEATANNANLLALVSPLLSLGTTEILWFYVSYPRFLSFEKCSVLLQFNAKTAYQIALLVLNAHISESWLSLRQIIEGAI